ncbi:oxygenase MpaB family protein [Streptomyces sp. ACA25]|uniref:oxygenase MpaB family protein n=1 Tax=Streptomyces sp. ACA25 TaxID=3022596 RepID=UPI0023076645|nr:oxygenase MpaB family protein [Streptomyces sp. ACA25]MDB1088304.1 oxygenase MpaB family protein [Streptomyces sp. ACA25]
MNSHRPTGPHSGPAPGASAARAPRRGGPVWRFFGDARGTLLAPQLLLLQVSHPVVGAGVKEHSDFRSEPWPRLGRTLMSLNTVIYGGQRAATAEAARLIRVHAPMKGVDSAGRRYHALHPEAYHWVHATLVKGPVDAQRLFGRGLRPEVVEEYYREMRDVGRVWGLREHHLPPDWASFCAYYDTMVAERLEDNASVRDLLEELAHPAKPPLRLLPGPVWRPCAALAARYTRLVTVGTLPPVLRERLGLAWSPREERALRRFARLVRGVMLLVPPPARNGISLAVAYWATHRPGTDPRARQPLGAP